MQKFQLLIQITIHNDVNYFKVLYNCCSVLLRKSVEAGAYSARSLEPIDMQLLQELVGS